MSSSDSPNNKPSSVEQELGDILKKHLNPPLIALADSLGGFLSNLSPDPSTERILATYFELFALGFSLWDISYYYHQVHEYYYAGYLQATEEAGEKPSPELQDLLKMLVKFTRAMIAFTWCENAMICNDPIGLKDASKDAVTYMEEALRLLICSSLGSLLRSPIENYFDLYLKNFQGLQRCAEMYLAGLGGKDISISEQSEVEQLLSYLDANSPEIASILRAHYIFAQRFSQAQARRSTDLRVKEGKLLLRAIGYVGEELVEALFDKCKGNKIPDEVRLAARENNILGNSVSIHGSYMHDIFDTILGEEYLSPIIFEFPTKDAALTISDWDLIRDGEEESKGHESILPSRSADWNPIRDREEEVKYSVEKFQVCLTHFGSISVEFSISLTNVSVSHVRVLESLISPHVGRFDIVWRDAPSDIGRGSMNFVDYYLKSHYWRERVRNATHKELSLTLDKIDTVLKVWREELRKLATLVPRQFTELPDEPSEQKKLLDKVHETLQKHLQNMSDLAHKWIKEQESSTSSSLKKLAQEGEHLFPQGVRFERLMDIAQEVLKGIECFLRSNLSEEHHTSSDEIQTEPNYDFRRALRLDPNIGWSAILSCNRLILVERDGREIEPITEWDHQQIYAHPEFKGFIIQSREARAGLYDWLFVAMPPYRNLATIRSHETDMMCITENRTFLYLPDEPAYLVKQYIETARLLNDLRILVLSYNTIAKEQIKQLESLFKDMEHSKSYKIARMSMSESYAYLSSRREKIEVFRTHAEKILDLLRACTISKYQDHSDLLKEMIKASRMDDIRDSLEQNIANLDRFHAYLTERLKQRIDESSEATQRRIEITQLRINYLLVVLTLLSALSAIPAILTLFIDPGGLRTFLVSLPTLGVIGRIILLALLLILILLVRIMASLIDWLKSYNDLAKL